MTTVNLRILDPEREFFYFGDDILNHVTYTAVEVDDLSALNKDRMLTALDANIIESDITTSEVRAILGSTGGLIIVADIPARDALSPNQGDEVLVQDTGSGEWAKYQYDGGIWVETANETSASATTFQALIDTSVTFDLANDGKFIKYNNTSGFLELETIVIPAELTAGDIKTLYESNLLTNAFTDAEKLKLTSIQAGAQASYDAIDITFNTISNVDAELERLDAVKSENTHNHDLEYALIVHNHDLNYADLVHNHDVDYAPIAHTHANYADLVHTHGDLALDSHNHDLDYAAITHNHDTANDLLYSQLAHNHDAAYSDIAHDHTGVYQDLIQLPGDNNQVLVRNLNGVFYYVDLDTLNIAEINDAVTQADRTYSSNKIETLLTGKSDTSHNHDADYYTQAQVDTKLDRWKGAYNPLTTYLAGEEVSWDGSSYIALVDTTGDQPDISPVEWDISSSKGDIGPIGIGVPSGGTTGQILEKTTGTDYDTQWVTPGGSATIEAIIELSVGVTIPQRLVGATIPAGWTVQSAQDAANPTFGVDADTLVVTHNLTKMVIEASVWETESGGPDIVDGSTRIDLTAQGDLKNSLDKDSFGFTNLVQKINSARPVYIYMKLL